MARHTFDVLAYCFMPDHVHALLQATAEDSCVRRAMSAWKQKTGYEYRKTKGQPLWQNGYYDRVLRRDDDRIDVAAYLIANPLRAGIVPNVQEYPFWGSGVWSREMLIDAVQARRAR